MQDLKDLTDDIRVLRGAIDISIQRLDKKPIKPGTNEYQKLAEANGQRRIDDAIR